MLAAALGKKVSENLKQPLRDILAGRRFTEVLSKELTKAVTFTGEPQKLIVSLSEISFENTGQEALQLEPSLDASPLKEHSKRMFRKYNTVFWQAFISRHTQNTLRAIDPTYPFRWIDFKTRDDVPAGWITIPQDFLASTNQSWAQRKDAALENIELWCVSNQLNPDSFIEVDRASYALNSSNNAGIEKLKLLIEAVPSSKRSSLNLNLDLIYLLICGK